MWFWQKHKFEDGRTGWIAMNSCERCSVEFQSNNPSSTKYCPSCAAVVRREQNRERQRKFRENHKTDIVSKC